ncbi:MAG: alpha-L-fucosidase, partial [Planctomycetes bacterium]|nr:alpha-L-fucosidase [Planctomycetota bacterium]
MNAAASHASQAVLPPAPIAPVPTPRQLAWFEREMIAFVHFGVNTFTDREWGTGTEDPAIFNPTALDARQWARTCKEGGLRMVVLTAKHHDGFCLWPSKDTEHSVRSSPWRGGKGDVVRELADACREAGLDFGVYLSPWDRHEPRYGDSPRYNEYYLAQLTELLTGYGKVSELWFDGACGEGPNGKKQVYDFEAYWAKVRELQPMACMFSDVGPDVRWVGNEQGFASDPNWAMIDRAKMGLGQPNPDQTHGRIDGPDFVPTEVNTSIRPGWFYHAAEDDKVKPLAQLLDNYYASVGMNGVYMLNIPPDRRGLMHENDAARLREFRRTIEATFAKDLARGKAATATNTRGGAAAFGPEKAVDGDPATYWATDDGVLAAAIEVDVGVPVAFDRAVIQECIRLGQRVKAFAVEAWDGSAWKEVARGQTIGRKRILRFPAVTAQKVRLKIEDARACPTISAFGLYLAPPEDT